jgi:hypothetical protein
MFTTTRSGLSAASNFINYSGSSGSRRVLRRAAVAEGEDAERTKLQRTEGA